MHILIIWFLWILNLPKSLKVVETTRRIGHWEHWPKQRLTFAVFHEIYIYIFKILVIKKWLMHTKGVTLISPEAEKIDSPICWNRLPHTFCRLPALGVVYGSGFLKSLNSDWLSTKSQTFDSDENIYHIQLWNYNCEIEIIVSKEL